MELWYWRGEEKGKGSSQRLHELGSVCLPYLCEYQIYMPTYPMESYSAAYPHWQYVGHGQENGCRHEGVLSKIVFTFFFLRQVDENDIRKEKESKGLHSNSRSSNTIEPAVDFKRTKFVKMMIGCRICLLAGIFVTHFVGRCSKA